MFVHRLIALTLASLAGGCTGYRCDAMDDMFSVDEGLIEGDIPKILQEYALDDRSQIDCEIVCSYTYDRKNDWVIQSIDECTLSLTPTEGEPRETPAGSVQCSGREIEYFCDGRRPLGHIEAVLGDGSLAAHLAHSAHLEAASVVAFEEIAEALSEAEAPAELIDRCRRAADDERRHAARVGACATSRGVTPPPARQSPLRPTLTAIAIDNAREGCVLETWSALRAAWLAEHAGDPELRELYAEIAADEAAHAQLSWDLHSWLLGQVSPATRATVERTLTDAIGELPQLARRQASESPAELAMPVGIASSLAERFAAGLSAAA